MMPVIDALLFLFLSTLGSGVVITAITAYSVLRIQKMRFEITQLKADFKAGIEAAEKRCDQRMASSEKALSDYADLLAQFAEAAGYRDIAKTLAERVTGGIRIDAGEDVIIGRDLVGRDKVEAVGSRPLRENMEIDE
jgi:hypothetical protein